MKKEYQFISYCGKYYCALCAYHRGTIVSAAKNLLKFVERYGSLKLIASSSNTYNFDEFFRGLKWLASQRKPCKGCRFGGGWSWWPDCSVRECCIQRNVDFCHQCKDFPCKELKEEPLLERKKAMIEANNRIETIGIQNWMEQLRKKYKQKRTRNRETIGLIDSAG